MIIRKYLIYLGILTFNTLLYSANWDWKTHTSTLKIQDMCGNDEKIWCATQGGLIGYNPVTGYFSTWTNTEGLDFTSVTSVVSDNQGRIWMGLENGILQRYNPFENNWLTVTDYEDRQITCLYYQTDTLFVGLDIGISIYLVNREEVKETYRRLGTELQVEIPVRDILIQSNEIWLGTDEGLAYSNLDNPNLLNPNSWNNVTLDNGLLDEHITSIVSYDGGIVAGTEGGIARWDGEHWNWELFSSIIDLTVHDNLLYAVTIYDSNEVHYSDVYHENDGQWTKLGISLKAINNILSSQSSLWVGSDEGIHFYSENIQNWEHLIPNCMGSNTISAVDFDQYNNLWCCSRDNGFFKFENSNWNIFNKKALPELQNNNFYSIFIDQNIYLGSWGGGVVTIKQDTIFNFYQAENSPLVGVSEDHDYVAVPDMAIDSFGTAWILNYRALTNQPLYAVTSDSV